MKKIVLKLQELSKEDLVNTNGGFLDIVRLARILEVFCT